MSTSLQISNIPVRQDSTQRYCLNDLHKASGNDPKNKPSEWLRNKQTIELVDLLVSEQSIAGIPTILTKQVLRNNKSLDNVTCKSKGVIPPILTKQGLGTYAVKELVYAYAMWISPKFHIKVIRAYDAMLQKKAEPIQNQLTEIASPYITQFEADRLQHSIRAHCKGNSDLYSETYVKIYHHFNLKPSKGDPAYKRIPAGKLQEAAQAGGITLVTHTQPLAHKEDLMYISKSEIDERIAAEVAERLKDIAPQTKDPQALIDEVVVALNKKGFEVKKIKKPYNYPLKDLSLNKKVGATAWLNYAEWNNIPANHRPIAKLCKELELDGCNVEAVKAEYLAMTAMLNHANYLLSGLKSITSSYEGFGAAISLN